MDIEQQNQVTKARLSRLREAVRDVQACRDKAMYDLSARETRLGLLTEDAAVLVAPEETRIHNAVISLRKTADLANAEIVKHQWPIFGFLNPRSRLKKAAACIASTAADEALKYLPSELSAARRDAQEQVVRNSLINIKKRRALGSLPKMIGMMNSALEAVLNGDPAVSTCLLRGQVDRALRVAAIWKNRQLGHTLTSHDIGEYISASSERDAPYEAEDQEALRAEQARAMSVIAEEKLAELRIRNILRALQESGPEFTTVEAEWEEIRPVAPLLLQDIKARGITS